MNRKIKLVIIGLVLIGIFSLYFVFAWIGQEPVRYTPPYTIGEKCYSSYDSVSKVMTDTSCLQFKTETNGVITINNERYLAFALKGKIGETEYTYTSMDFSWTWHVEEDNGDYTFWAENDNPNFIWRQYYYFYEDYNKPMKIEHYLENNLNDITDAQMYYLTNVLPTDEIEYNETRYLVSDYMGLHKQGNFNELNAVLSFNDMYDFRFDDLIDEGFTINEFYIGSGSVIGKPNVNITAIGFTKNNGNFPKGSSILIDPVFSIRTMNAVHTAPLSENTFVIAYCDDYWNDISFQIFNTNGTVLVAETDADSSIGTCSDTLVSVSAFNSTSFIIGWNDNDADNVQFSIYDTSGNLMTGPIEVDNAVGAYSRSVSVSAFNSTAFVIGWVDFADEDATFSIYDTSGNLMTGPIDVDDAIGQYTYAVSVSTFNSTAFVIGWFDTVEDYIEFSIYSYDGTLMNGPTIVDNDCFTSRAVSVATLNSTAFVIAWKDGDESDVSYRVYNSAGTAQIDEKDADTDVGSGYQSVQVETFNSTHFIITWYDHSEYDLSYDIFNSTGTSLLGITDLEAWETSSAYPHLYQSVANSETATGIGICENNWIVAYGNTTTQAIWRSFKFDGSVWDGICPLPDTTKPTYSNNQTNTTIAGASVNFSILYDDDTALEPDGDWVFSTNNTGVWANESAVSFTATPEWANVTKTLNSTVGIAIGYRWYANDSAGNNNNTGIYVLTTTTGVQSYTRNVTQPTTITGLTDRTGSLERDTPQSLTATSLVDRLGNIIRSILDYTTINNLVDRTSTFFRDLSEYFTINGLTDRFKVWIRNIPQDLTINTLVDRIGSFFRSILQEITINILAITDASLEFIRNIQQDITINALITRLTSIFRDLPQDFTINSLTDRIGSIIKNILQNLLFGLFKSPTTTDGLVSWWTFDIGDFNSTTAFDIWGINNGTRHPDITEVSGYIGEAFGFDGNSTGSGGNGTYLDCGNDTSLNNITTGLTIEAWIKPAMSQESSENYGVASVVSDPLSSSTWSWQIRYGASPDNSLGFQLNTAGGGKWVKVGQNLVTDEWYHILVTFNGSETRFYLDGELVDTNIFSTTTINVNPANKLLIGTEGWANYFNGTIDEFKIYNRSLSEDEISRRFFSLDTTYSAKRSLSDSFSISFLTDRIGSFFRNPPQSISTNFLTGRITSLFKTITQSFSIDSIIGRINSFLKTVTQSIIISSLVEKVTTIANRIATDYFRVIVNYAPSFVERLVSFFRNPLEILNFNALLDRLTSLFKKIIQSFNINAIVERIRSVLRSVIDFFQMLFSLFTSGTFLPFNWITSTETTTQLPAYEGSRVNWEFNDNWTVSATSPQNWTNATETFSLPTDCANVHIEIDGEDRTGSILVNNTDCDYTVINNNTLDRGDSSLINITYTTTAITSSEGSWLAYNKRIYEKTGWRNTLTLSNPSTHDYGNISINITTDKYAISTEIKVVNATETFSHTFDNSNGNTNWSIDLLNSGDNNIFTIDYNTTKINITKVNHSETILGKDYEIWNVTIDANSTRSILSVYSYFNFSDDGVIANRFYKCDNGFVNCTEDISNRIDVAWSDNDGDGYYDKVEWYITSLSQNQSYQLHNDKGFPVEVTTESEILNKPVYAFDNILWRTTITMYNANAFSTEKIYKYEFPIGATDIELDDIRKNLQFDPFGTLAPFLTIIDKDQVGNFPNSVYLSPGQTKTFIVEYRTESVTVYASTYFPSYFEVDENALIVQTLRINNQAEDEVEDIEYRIPIDYAEDLIVCETERKDGCIEDEEDSQYDNLTIDTQDSVKGDYTLELDSLNSGETKYITLSYYIPTAIVENIEKGRRSVQGVLADYKKVTILSTAPYTMKDLRYKETEIKVGNVIDIFECQVTGICDIPLIYDITPFNVKLGITAIGERKEFYIWSIPEGESKEYESWFDDTLDWFVEKIWDGGNKIEIKGFLKYIIGWLGTEDVTTGELYIPLYRLILIGSIVGLIIGIIIFFRMRKRRKVKKEKTEMLK